MSDIIDGVDGEWVRSAGRIVKSGQHYRFGGQWHGQGEDLDMERAFNRAVIELDDEDYLEVFVPDSNGSLPDEDGIYADIDGDAWRLFDGKWTYLAGPEDWTDPGPYVPLRKIADLWGNFEDEEY